MSESPVPARSPTRQPRWGANPGSKRPERAPVQSARHAESMDGAEPSGSIEQVMAGRHSGA